MTDADAEWTVLTTPAGQALLAEAEAVERPGPAEIGRWRALAAAELVAAAVRLAGCRRRAAGKFARAGEMWLEPEGLEQATAEPVARHKARRLDRGTAVVVDLCCGLGGDALALAGAGADVLAVDLDPAMGRRVRWNAAVYGVSDRVTPIRGRAEMFPIPAGARVHLDPDRRALRPGRARALADYAPGPDYFRALARSSRGGAIKVGPAADFDRHFGGGPFEVELVSLGGECKEATVWFGDLAGCRRRATRLPDGATWTDREAPADPPALAGEALGPWLYDPDPALRRSGLLPGFAAAHGLALIGGDVDLLTGPDPAPVASPWLAAFEILEVLPLDLKRLRRRVADRGLGPLEIKVRGVDLRPESLRTRLRPAGPNPATLLVFAGSGPGRAVLARRGSRGEG